MHTFLYGFNLYTDLVFQKQKIVQFLRFYSVDAVKTKRQDFYELNFHSKLGQKLSVIDLFIKCPRFNSEKHGE